MPKANAKPVKKASAGKPAASGARTKKAAVSASAPAESNLVFLNVVVPRTTRSALTKLKTELGLGNQGEVVARLVREELKRRKAAKG